MHLITWVEIKIPELEPVISRIEKASWRRSDTLSVIIIKSSWLILFTQYFDGIKLKKWEYADIFWIKEMLSLYDDIITWLSVYNNNMFKAWIYGGAGMHVFVIIFINAVQKGSL